MSLAASISQALAQQAETVCRHYLSSGYRYGDTWKAGDVLNTKPKPRKGSLVVQLSGDRAGRWRDFNPAAPRGHGDLLDLIQYAKGYADLRDAMGEARQFLGSTALPSVQPRSRASQGQEREDRKTGTQRAVGIFKRSKRIAGSQAEGYLFMRGIASADRYSALRVHPSLRYPIDPENPEPLALSHYPAMVAAVTDVHGNITGIQRTFLELGMPVKAKVEEPRKSLGSLYGQAVWLGKPAETVVIGEGIETVLSVLEARPDLSGAAALAADNMPALTLPEIVKRLLIARDNDPAGKAAAEKLRDAAELKGIDVVDLTPSRNDFNDDLRAFGPSGLAELLRDQIPSS